MGQGGKIGSISFKCTAGVIVRFRHHEGCLPTMADAPDRKWLASARNYVADSLSSVTTPSMQSVETNAVAIRGFGMRDATPLGRFGPMGVIVVHPSVRSGRTVDLFHIPHSVSHH